jgi:cyclopentanol dehydrogenase
MKRLENKVALITGAGGGQGATEAKLFASNGAKVVITDISSDALQKVEAYIIENGGEVLSIVHDVSSEDQWKDVIKQTIERFGALNILINNAGIMAYEGVEGETLEGWNRVGEINSTSVFLGMKYAAPEMRKKGGGSIINISSIYGNIGSAGAIAYHATKGAVRLMTKSAAIELAKDNIRVNSIHPGIIQTNMIAHLDESVFDEFRRLTPIPRLGKPEDIAFGAIYLASDESSFITGSELVIDGGWLAQ